MSDAKQLKDDINKVFADNKISYRNLNVINFILIF